MLVEKKTMNLVVKFKIFKHLIQSKKTENSTRKLD